MGAKFVVFVGLEERGGLNDMGNLEGDVFLLNHIRQSRTCKEDGVKGFQLAEFAKG